jgi:rhodanese-related sulfurtransferase
LLENGYTEAYALVGGTQGWTGAGYPTEGSAVKK